MNTNLSEYTCFFYRTILLNFDIDCYIVNDILQWLIQCTKEKVSLIKTRSYSYELMILIIY